MGPEMEPSKSSLERAFDIARQGKVRRVRDIARQLDREGYDPRQLQGPALAAQLRQLLRQAYARELLNAHDDSLRGSPGAGDAAADEADRYNHEGYSKQP